MLDHWPFFLGLKMTQAAKFWQMWIEPAKKIGRMAIKVPFSLGKLMLNHDNGGTLLSDKPWQTYIISQNEASGTHGCSIWNQKDLGSANSICGWTNGDACHSVDELILSTAAPAPIRGRLVRACAFKPDPPELRRKSDDAIGLNRCKSPPLISVSKQLQNYILSNFTYIQVIQPQKQYIHGTLNSFITTSCKIFKIILGID